MPKSQGQLSAITAGSPGGTRGMTSLTARQRGQNLKSVAQLIRSFSKYLKGNALPLEGLHIQEAIGHEL